MALRNFQAISKPFGHMVKKINRFLENNRKSRKTIHLDGYEQMIELVYDWFIDHIAEICNVQLFKKRVSEDKYKYHVLLTKWESYPVVKVILEPSERFTVDYLEHYLCVQNSSIVIKTHVEDLSISYDCEPKDFDLLLAAVTNFYREQKQEGRIGNHQLEVFVPWRHNPNLLESSGAKSVF